MNTATPKAPVYKPLLILPFAPAPHPDKTIIPEAEIGVALIDVMAAVAAMVEESLPRNLQAWAEDLTASQLPGHSCLTYDRGTRFAAEWRLADVFPRDKT